MKIKEFEKPEHRFVRSLKRKIKGKEAAIHLAERRISEIGKVKISRWLMHAPFSS